MSKSFKNKFEKSLKGKKLQAVLLDEYYRYLAFPFVLMLSEFKFVKPTHIVWFGLLLKLYFCYLIFTSSFQPSSAIILFVAIVLDYADGMLARLKNEVTSFGGFLDLGADIISSILLFISLAFHLDNFALSLLALVAFILPMEVWSFAKWQRRNSEKSSLEFLQLKAGDNAKCFELLLLKLYNLTWKQFAKLAFKIFDVEKINFSELFFKAFAVCSIGLNLTVLCVIIALQLDLQLYLYYQLLVFAVFSAYVLQKH